MSRFRVGLRFLTQLPRYLGIALLIILLPAIMLLIVLLNLLGIGRHQELSAREVATYLREFLDETSGPWDWDDFTSVGIAHPTLEKIRSRAAEVDLPLTPEGAAVLKGLLIEAERLAEEEAEVTRFLAEALRLVIDGDDITAEELAAGIAADPPPGKPARMAWQALSRWVADADIRARDLAYAQRQRERLARLIVQIAQ